MSLVNIVGKPATLMERVDSIGGQAITPRLRMEIEYLFKEVQMSVQLRRDVSEEDAIALVKLYAYKRQLEER